MMPQCDTSTFAAAGRPRTFKIATVLVDYCSPTPRPTVGFGYCTVMIMLGEVYGEGRQNGLFGV